MFILTRHTVSWDLHPGVSTTKNTSVFFLLQRSAFGQRGHVGPRVQTHDRSGLRTYPQSVAMCRAQPTFSATLVILVLLPTTRVFVQLIPCTYSGVQDKDLRESSAPIGRANSTTTPHHEATRTPELQTSLSSHTQTRNETSTITLRPTRP